MEAELQTATDAMHTTWQRLKMDTRDAQLRRTVRKTFSWLKRMRSAANSMFARLRKDYEIRPFTVEV